MDESLKCINLHSNEIMWRPFQNKTENSGSNNNERNGFTTHTPNFSCTTICYQQYQKIRSFLAAQSNLYLGFIDFLRIEKVRFFSASASFLDAQLYCVTSQNIRCLLKTAEISSKKGKFGNIEESLKERHRENLLNPTSSS